MIDIGKKHWHACEINDVFKSLNSTDLGLDNEEAKRRLNAYGDNRLKIQTSETIPRILLRQLANPIVYMLLFSALAAFLLDKFTDGFVILSVVVLNTAIGFIHEYHAHQIIKELIALTPHQAVVVRGGLQRLIAATQLTLGDIVYLQPGDKVPADLRLFFVKGLQCDEAVLTGESLPVFKHAEKVSSTATIAERKSMAFSGTYVTAGIGYGIVVATGFNTEFGKVAQMIERVAPLQTPLSRMLKELVQWISAGILVIGSLAFMVGSIRGNSPFDSLFSAISLVVAAIPEGLLAIVTIASAVGIRSMAKRQAIIRQLPAVECLGSIDTICTDKTGTLTLNEMTVQRVWTPSGFSFVTGAGYNLGGEIISLAGNHQEIFKVEVVPFLKAIVLCNDATLEHTAAGLKVVGDPTEIALLIAARKGQLSHKSLRDTYQRLDSLPFEPELKRMATLNIHGEDQNRIYLKGAPETILKACLIDRGLTSEILKVVDEMAKEEMRVLGVAIKDVKGDKSNLDEEDLMVGFTFLGLVGLLDPPRNEVYCAIKACHEAGITIKMVTGDHPSTAKAVGLDLGLISEDYQVITGYDLDRLDANEWRKIVSQANVFARVTPGHKLKIVEALQEEGRIVAMTGDGVNDAPALKKADIGIAMGIKGTAVAKEAADMVLADDNFASIEAAVEEGRRVYDNLIKSLIFILSTGLGQALVVLMAVFFFPISGGNLLHPVLPVQILWINLVVAVGLALPLAFEVAEGSIMKRPPRSKTSSVLSICMIKQIFFVGFLMAVGTVALFLWEYQLEISRGVEKMRVVSEAQTMAVTAMVLFQIFYLLDCRSLSRPFWKVDIRSNPWIFVGIGGVLFAQIVFIYLPWMNDVFGSKPLDLGSWLMSIFVSIIIFIFMLAQLKFFAGIKV